MQRLSAGVEAFCSRWSLLQRSSAAVEGLKLSIVVVLTGWGAVLKPYRNIVILCISKHFEDLAPLQHGAALSSAAAVQHATPCVERRPKFHMSVTLRTGVDDDS